MKLAVEENKKIEVDAVREYDHVAITPSGIKPKWYRITHKKSGYALGPAMTLTQAVKVCEMIDAHPDFFSRLNARKKTKMHKAADYMFRAFCIANGVDIW